MGADDFEGVRVIRCAEQKYVIRQSVSRTRSITPVALRSRLRLLLQPTDFGESRVTASFDAVVIRVVVYAVLVAVRDGSWKTNRVLSCVPWLPVKARE